jgi:hypothetical protein
MDELNNNSIVFKVQKIWAVAGVVGHVIKLSLKVSSQAPNRPDTRSNSTADGGGCRQHKNNFISKQPPIKIQNKALIFCRSS